MGGINHQPCSEYDPQAILLSNTLSRAYSKFWSGNGEIENALSLEIGGMLDQAEFALTQAQSDIGESLRLIKITDENMSNLLRAMEEKHFQDLSSLNKMDFTDFEQNLRKIGLLPKDVSSWRFSVENISKGGYRKIFMTLRTYFGSLSEKTQHFLNVLRQAQSLIEEGDLQKSFNEKRFNKFKHAFGSLFCTWSETLYIYKYKYIDTQRRQAKNNLMFNSFSGFNFFKIVFYFFHFCD